MELLAFVHTAVHYENPTPDPEVTLFDGNGLNVSSAAWTTLAGVAVAVAVSTSPGEAVAAATSYGQGSSGDEVASIQKALGLKADGQYGSKTETAVMDFQIRQGLKQVDGMVGKETATALGLDEKYRPVYLGYVDTYSGIGLNVRGGPGLDYRRIGGLEDGTVVETYGEEVDRYGYTWQQLDYDAWVATDYVEPYYEPVSYYEDDCYYYDDYSYDDHYYDDYGYEPVDYYHDDYYDDYYSPVSYSDGGGYVDTYSGIGLNIRYGPCLGYGVYDAVPDGTYLPTVDGTVYSDGYAWEELPDGNWIAADYLY